MPDFAARLRNWWAEAARRKVIRVAVVYVVVAWILIQVAGQTFEPLGLPDWSTRLVIILAALGLPLALALAWAFDVGPRGIERTATPPVDSHQPSPATRAADPPAPSAPASQPHQSVAILPFVDMSQERDQDYFCDGIAEEIINALCCVRGLKVASRTSAFQFKGRNDDVREIGRTLAVGAVLEGSVRKAGDRLRITAQLVGTLDGYHLWSETFDRRLEDVFAIQTEIAQQVARTLSSSLTSGEAARLERGGTASSDAYEYYLRGRALLRRHGSARLQARQMFQRSIETDPAFALGHAGLAAALADEIFWGQARNRAVIEQALQEVSRAEELQPGLVEVMVARGSLLSAQGRDAEANAAFDLAIDRAPNLADVYYWYARHAFSSGDHARAARLFERTVELDPTNFTASGLLGSALETLGQTERAIAAHARAAQLIDRQLELYPDDVRAMQFGAATNATLGRRERALELIDSALALQRDTPGALYNIACGYARLGEPEKALELLEQWVDIGAGSLPWIREDPDLVSLRELPRFAALQARIAARQIT
jgi:adenylate cyclase